MYWWHPNNPWHRDAAKSLIEAFGWDWYKRTTCKYCQRNLGTEKEHRCPP